MPTINSFYNRCTKAAQTPKTMTTFTKIITHAGQFHADEVLSIALLRVLGCNAPIERTYSPTEGDLNDPAVCVLDVGKTYQPELFNFDHHQDGKLEAADMLLLRHFEDEIGLAVAIQLSKRLFQAVSDIDRGRLIIRDENMVGFSSMIRSFNSLPDGFNRAVAVATEILTAFIETTKKALADESRWYGLSVHGAVAVQHDTDPILCWKEKAKEEGIFVLVCPSLRGGYSVISRDTAELAIPVDARQTFRHASGFMATYATFQEALDHAKAIVPVA